MLLNSGTEQLALDSTEGLVNMKIQEHIELESAAAAELWNLHFNSSQERFFFFFFFFFFLNNCHLLGAYSIIIFYHNIIIILLNYNLLNIIFPTANQVSLELLICFYVI